MADSFFACRGIITSVDQLPADFLSVLSRNTTSPDIARITKAYLFAQKAHFGQTRLSGEAFISHPLAVATYLAGWNLDTESIVAGLLHDTVEDAGVSRDQLVKEFGATVDLIVNGVTKITEIRLTGSTRDLFVENLRKMLVVMAKDLRVILVKLADRTHNMQTLNFLSSEKQHENARETLEVYAPLAERLGMGEVKGQLEDLAFPYVYPQEYANLQKMVKPLLGTERNYIEGVHRQLLELILPDIPNAIINTRQKHMYSLFRKLARQEIAGDISKIHDLFAARVIVDTIPQCYQVLGLVHTRFHPVPYLGLSDYIATPKPNGYQSLHTRVFGPGGKILELQIRTRSMHEHAEMGIAAHWTYAQAKNTAKSDAALQSALNAPTKLDWVRQLLNWQQELRGNDEFMDALTLDAFKKRILVFSPQGDVYDLPAAATPVDYAYAVHTKLGSSISSAKINGRMVPLNHLLKNGDVVEVIIDKKRRKPNPDWLEFVVSTAARRSIAKELGRVS